MVMGPQRQHKRAPEQADLSLSRTPRVWRLVLVYSFSVFVKITYWALCPLPLALCEDVHLGTRYVVLWSHVCPTCMIDKMLSIELPLYCQQLGFCPKERARELAYNYITYILLTYK